ncbi:MAG: ABC transporter ATP-binding protein [Clostridia bacterium]|nr:ABC transporter ATP-binding protein [Clostridia bacterium]
MKNKKRTLKEDISMIKRAVKIVYKICPPYFNWKLAQAVTDIIIPYYSLYMTSVMLNELSGECNSRKLTLYALITVIGCFITSLLNRFVSARCEVHSAHYNNLLNSYYMEQQIGFQFEHLENPDVVLMKSKIDNYANVTGNGLNFVANKIIDIFRTILQLFVGSSFAMPLVFRGEWKLTGGILDMLASPIAGIAVIAIYILLIYFDTVVLKKLHKKMKTIIDDRAELSQKNDAYEGLYGADTFIFGLNKTILAEEAKFSLKPIWIKKHFQLTAKGTILLHLKQFLGEVLVFLYAAVKVYTGNIGIGDFVLFYGSIFRALGNVNIFTEFTIQLLNNNDYLEAVFEYIDLPNNMYKGTLAVEKRDDIDYEIEFRDVSFKYPSTDIWVLRHVNMKFKIGEKLAVVGMNGSGKTTFIKLMCRLYDPTEGKILLNGIDITRYRYDEYLALFAVVFQDYTVYGFPLGENIAVSENYDREKVLDCVNRVGLSEKLSTLERGLETPIGRSYENNGVDFSGGEKQKIALARALYKGAPFIVLDEPTAALDPLAEAEVYASFNKAAVGHTAIYISHRLSSCRFCDRIVVFDSGSVVQTGSHDELLADETGKYRELWHAQAQYYD